MFRSLGPEFFDAIIARIFRRLLRARSNGLANARQKGAGRG